MVKSGQQMRVASPESLTFSPCRIRFSKYIKVIDNLTYQQALALSVEAKCDVVIICPLASS